MYIIAHNFIILLLLAKTTVIYSMPLILPFILINNEYTGVNKHTDYIKKNTLKLLNKLPVVHKLVFTKISSINSLNSSLVKFTHNNISVQLNNVKRVPCIKTSSFVYNVNSKPNSTIVSAKQSAKTISTCLMFTYNDKSNFIAINRLSVVNIPNIKIQILRVEELGYFKQEINLALKLKPSDI